MKTIEPESSELSDLCHEYNNLSQRVFAAKMSTGYKSKELRKILIARSVFCLSMIAACVLTITLACLLATDPNHRELGPVLFSLSIIMSSELLAGWWISCRVIAKEKILIGHGIS